MADNAFYPSIEPYDKGHLAVGGPHQIYYEQAGNPKGVPVVFLHGGPGAGSSPTHRRFFDPTHYRIVIFDQRGSGRSRPLGEIRENSTPHLITDIELLRRTLGIERWLVFGGSWGSTLALAYAEHHPDRVMALCLRGIFLCRKVEIDWFLDGMKYFMPEAHRDFLAPLSPRQRENVLESYFEILMNPDPAVHLPAARIWSAYEAICCTLLPSPETVEAAINDVTALGLARMEAHYFRNNIFLPDNFLLENVGKIRHIPAFIVQGRYDLVCPPFSADDLKRVWPEADYHLVWDAGHSAMEPGIRSALVAAMDRFRAIK